MVSGPPEPEVVVDGKKVLMFTSNNYLGLANHPRVVQSAVEAVNNHIGLSHHPEVIGHRM